MGPGSRKTSCQDPPDDTWSSSSAHFYMIHAETLARIQHDSMEGKFYESEFKST